MFGSFTIYEELQKKNYPVTLYSYPGKGHDVSGYMFSHFTEMDQFMKQAVKGNAIPAAHIRVTAE